MLNIVQSIELPPDVRSDEISLQLVSCALNTCGFRDIAIYEESRRGALDSDHWDHTGFHVSSGGFEELQVAIAACPEPSNTSCPCDSHKKLGNVSSTGRWQPPEGVKWGSAFPIER